MTKAARVQQGTAGSFLSSLRSSTSHCCPRCRAVEAGTSAQSPIHEAPRRRTICQTTRTASRVQFGGVVAVIEVSSRWARRQQIPDAVARGSLLRGQPPMPLHRCLFDPERTMRQADSAAAAPLAVASSQISPTVRRNGSDNGNPSETVPFRGSGPTTRVGVSDRRAHPRTGRLRINPGGLSSE